jgi:regulatory protein
VSGGPDPSDEVPAADALPDLVGDGPGWDGPLTDLAEAQAGLQGPADPGSGRARDVIGADAGGVLSDDAPPADLAPGAADGGTGARGPDLDDLSGPEAGGGDDLWAPLPIPAIDVPAGTDGDAPADLTRRPRRGRGARRSRRAADSRTGANDPGASEVGASEGAVPVEEGPVGRATGPVEDAPVGLASDPVDVGGVATGGLEPGTLFSNPDLAGPAGGRRGGRRGRARKGGRAPEGRRSTDGEGSTDDDGTSAGATSGRPLTAEERLQHALKLAYRHLTKRDRTVSEVRTHLEKREIDEASIAAALSELLEFGYLDDERYAARFVEDKRRLEGWGHLRIEQGLRRTGVDREIADRAVAADPLRDDEPDLAVETLERRFGGRPPEDDRARQKALRVLATKGYPLDTAYAAVRVYERRCAERAED